MPITAALHSAGALYSKNRRHISRVSSFKNEDRRQSHFSTLEQRLILVNATFPPRKAINMERFITVRIMI